MQVVWPQLSVALRYGLSWSYESWNRSYAGSQREGGAAYFIPISSD
jgi:hypothetical protein